MSHQDDIILNPILDAFTKIQIQDMRVKKIELTHQKYVQLMASPRMQHHWHINFGTRDTKSIEDCTELRQGPPVKGQLFGADIFIGKRCKVYSEGETFPDIRSGLIQVSERINFFGSGISIFVKSRAKPLYKVESNEWVAIETLREMITETNFRKYMKYGFILVKGESGNVYQIFRNKSHIKVWNKGKVIEEICVKIKDSKIPPTDSLIAFKVMIETDENEFKKTGNVYKMAA